MKFAQMCFDLLTREEWFIGLSLIGGILVNIVLIVLSITVSSLFIISLIFGLAMGMFVGIIMQGLAEYAKKKDSDRNWRTLDVGTGPVCC